MSFSLEDRKYLDDIYVRMRDDTDFFAEILSMVFDLWDFDDCPNFDNCANSAIENYEPDYDESRI